MTGGGSGGTPVQDACDAAGARPSLRAAAPPDGGSAPAARPCLGRDGSDAEGLTEVLRCLDEEEWTSGRLCEFARRKQRILVAGAAADLPPLVQAEQVMLAGLSRSEARRARAARPLAQALGLPAGASIEQLAGRLDASSAAAIRAVGTRIAASLTEIGALNRQNTRLIQQSLAFVNFSLGIIARAVGEADTYAPVGRRVRREVVPRALNREV